MALGVVKSDVAFEDEKHSLEAVGLEGEEGVAVFVRGVIVSAEDAFLEGMYDSVDASKPERTVCRKGHGSDVGKIWKYNFFGRKGLLLTAYILSCAEPEPSRGIEGICGGTLRESSGISQGIREKGR